MDPQMLAQLLMRSQAPTPQQQAYQTAQAPGQMAMSMGNAAPGTNVGAGTTNALTKLALAMMQRKRMQDYQKQYGTPQVPTQAQGQTLSGPVDNSSAPTGMMGPP
jgi:hypothetical protein